LAVEWENRRVGFLRYGPRADSLRPSGLGWGYGLSLRRKPLAPLVRGAVAKRLRGSSPRDFQGVATPWTNRGGMGFQGDLGESLALPRSPWAPRSGRRWHKLLFASFPRLIRPISLRSLATMRGSTLCSRLAPPSRGKLGVILAPLVRGAVAKRLRGSSPRGISKGSQPLGPFQGGYGVSRGDLRGEIRIPPDPLWPRRRRNYLFKSARNPAYATGWISPHIIINTTENLPILAGQVFVLRYKNNTGKKQRTPSPLIYGAGSSSLKCGS